ncbi:MAG: hypothetical protein HOB82_02540 [Alphaproteobacteria bacterium]|jgi:hypothetical protein|nr:hypothetical protein [Alphaproteobacteria bacterium]
MADLGILVIHGTGLKEESFAEPVKKHVNKQVRAMGVRANQLAWKSVFWADILKQSRSEYLSRARLDNDLDFLPLREFIVSAVGDSAAYRPVDETRDDYDPAADTYARIHSRVREAVASLHETLGGQDKPLVIMAHSLGSHIMSNYIWDMQHGAYAEPSPTNRFERLETLRAFITFGCPIPIFTFSKKNPMPITLPDGAIWENYYDPADVLAYPLRAINDAFAAAVSHDFPISVGGPLTKWNPLSHDEYWADPDQAEPIAHHIYAILNPPEA